MKRKSRIPGKALAAALLAAVLLSLSALARGADPIVVNPDCAPLTREETLAMAETAAYDFYQNAELRKELMSEIVSVTEAIPNGFDEAGDMSFYVLTHGGSSMRFFMDIAGAPGENGRYPLYISLHGGGEGPSEGNNDQWIAMSHYYRDSVESGICVACRGITDTWDLHFRDESYPLYDRLIEAMVVLYDADPDRVYLLGFSAGGDGVYQVSPRLADRFAAVNMSSGHPNGVSLLNLANCPICLQSGIRDWYSEDAMRSVRTAEFDAVLSDHRQKYGFGYEHLVCIHVPAGHNFVDYRDCESAVLKDPSQFAALASEGDALELFLDVLDSCGEGRDVGSLSYNSTEVDPAFDAGIARVAAEALGLETVTVNTNAVRWVSRFTRDPAPANLVWDLSTRARTREKNSFYWLEADPSVDRGVITASYDASSNTVTVEAEDVNGDFAILFHPALVDVSRPVTVRAGGVVCTVQVNPSAEFLDASIFESGDPNLGCVGKILYSEVLQYGE